MCQPRLVVGSVRSFGNFDKTWHKLKSNSKTPYISNSSRCAALGSSDNASLCCGPAMNRVGNYIFYQTEEVEGLIRCRECRAILDEKVVVCRACRRPLIGYFPRTHISRGSKSCSFVIFAIESDCRTSDKSLNNVTGRRLAGTPFGLHRLIT